MVRVLKMPHEKAYDETNHREALTAIEQYRNHGPGRSADSRSVGRTLAPAPVVR